MRRPDRREPFTDPSCGGCLYAHIAYARQLKIKSQVIADALGRIGRIRSPDPIAVAASPDEGYRMRARLHLRGGQIGFFHEGSHELCDARGTRQLLPATADTIDRVAAALQSLEVDQVREIEVSENIDASERVIHLHAAAPLDQSRLASVGQIAGLSGLTISRFSGGHDDFESRRHDRRRPARYGHHRSGRHSCQAAAPRADILSGQPVP